MRHSMPWNSCYDIPTMTLIIAYVTHFLHVCILNIKTEVSQVPLRFIVVVVLLFYVHSKQQSGHVGMVS